MRTHMILKDFYVLHIYFCIFSIALKQLLQKYLDRYKVSRTAFYTNYSCKGGDIISILNGHEEWFHNGSMEVTEVKRQRQSLMLSCASLGLLSFFHHFVFVCSKQKNPSVHAQTTLFLRYSTSEEISMLCRWGRLEKSENR